MQPEKNWQIKKYAGVLKEVAGLILGVSSEKFEEEEFKNSELGKEWNILNYDHDSTWSYPMTVRLFLQKLGTEGGRAVHPNLWINALYSNYFPLTYSDRGGYEYPNWIITDCRFPNEVSAVKQRGGIVIRIERSDLLRLGKEDTDRHPSETALDNFKDWDFVIDNNNSKESLIKSVNYLISNYE